MNRADFDPIADHLIVAYVETAVQSRAMTDRYGQPPTRMAKVHILLSIAQAQLTDDDRYVLGSDYSEYGKISITSRESGERFILRSSAAVTIEGARSPKQALFDSSGYLCSKDLLLIHSFHAKGLDLSIAGARLAAGKKRLEMTGVPSFVGSWSFADAASSADAFNQGHEDAFRELGDLGNDDRAVQL